jgi:hypothetical protein
MKNLRWFLLTVLLPSCGGSALTKKMTGSDSLVITFNLPNSDSVIKTVTTTEKKAIQKLAGFLDGSPEEQLKCGYDGNMIFYKQGIQLLPVVFRYSDQDCRHFLFDLDNKVMSTRMSNEAVNLLQSLKEGRNWY